MVGRRQVGLRIPSYKDSYLGLPRLPSSYLLSLLRRKMPSPVLSRRTRVSPTRINLRLKCQDILPRQWLLACDVGFLRRGGSRPLGLGVRV